MNITPSSRLIEILDIGAAPEGEPRWKGLPANVTSVEPRDGDPFLGDGRSWPFYTTRYGPCSSLFKPNAGLIDELYAYSATDPGGNFTVVKEEIVETVRLDALYPDRRFDLIKIDTQGSELMILQGGGRTVMNALVVEVEVSFEPLYEYQPLFGEVDEELRVRGFAFHRFVDFSGRCIRPLGFKMNPGRAMSQLLQADAVYVRHWWETLEDYSNEDLLVAAAILGDVYHSYDLAARLLKEHEQRTGEGHYQRFLQVVQQAVNQHPDWLSVRE